MANYMKTIIPYSIIALLVIIFLLEQKNIRLERERNLRNHHELQLELDSLQTQLRETELERLRLDSLNSVLNLRNETLEWQLKKANDKLADIPGKFDSLNNKELESKMIEEWKKGR